MRCKHILSLPTSRSALIGLLSGSAALAAVNLAHAQPLAPAATETVLYDFRGGTDGANPHAGLISDSKGVLYGTTWRGGGTGCVAGLGCGTVFKLTPPAPGQTKWTKRTLYRFTATARLPLRAWSSIATARFSAPRWLEEALLAPARCSSSSRPPSGDGMDRKGSLSLHGHRERRRRASGRPHL
jgi:hypothetical protein